MAEPTLPSPNFNSTLGALLVGGLFAAAFWGVTSAQTYMYYQRYPNDPQTLKWIVAILWVLDTFDVCLTSHILYHYLVMNFMNPAAIAAPVWSVLVHVAVTSVTDVMIRCMFARRVWRISGGNIILTAIVLAISLCDLVVGLIITIKAFGLESFTQLGELSTLFYINFGAGVSGDLFVAIIMCYYLFRSRTGFQSTDTLVKTLIAYIITTGLLTSINAIFGTVFYATMPTNFIFIGFYFNLAKMYINSYLALLNARRHLREGNEGGISFQLSRLSDQPYATTNLGTDYFAADNSTSSHTDKQKPVSPGDLAVHIQTTVDRKAETGIPHFERRRPTRATATMR